PCSPRSPPLLPCVPSDSQVIDCFYVCPPPNSSSHSHFSLLPSSPFLLSDSVVPCFFYVRPLLLPCLSTRRLTALFLSFPPHFYHLIRISSTDLPLLSFSFPPSHFYRLIW
ncbi:hypothetical protein PFISCL1PPCAC_8673, partial [Pristionchus fissidentatus]